MHQRQALLLRLRGKFNTIQQSLRKHPEDIQDVWQLLLEKGRVQDKETPDGSGTGGTGWSPSEVKPERQEMKREEEQAMAAHDPYMTGADEAEGSTLEVVPDHDPETKEVLEAMSEEIPDRWLRFGGQRNQLPGKVLRMLMACCEPVAFSKYAIRAVIPHGKREVEAIDMLKYLEFMTGLDGCTELTGDFRKTLILIERLRELNESYGRPAKHLRLPANWLTDGWWNLDILDEENALLSSKFDGARKLHLTADVLDFFNETMIGVSLDLNWSYSRAVVVNASRSKRKNCKDLLLLGQDGQQPTELGAKRKREMKEEGQMARQRQRMPQQVKSELNESPPSPE